MQTIILNISGPRDLPLPLPIPQEVLVVLLVVSFLAHILFVNLMVGGSILTLWSEIKGLKNRDYDKLASELAATITVNKSIAVVLGVAPLLTINTLYTVYFYTANALTGLFWISIIPLVTIAFLLTYAHKYSWKVLGENKSLHISIIALAVAVFLFIPFIFLANINLMLFPEKWNTISGFLEALMLPNVFPRYLHFIFASLGITGLFVFGYFGRKKYLFEENFKTLTRYEVQKKAYSLTLMASVAQFLIGPVVLLTLPTQGMSWRLVLTIFTGAGFAIPALYFIWKGITGKPENIGKHYRKVVILLSMTVIFMGSGRQIYRATALEPHQQAMAKRTEEFQKLVKQAAREENDPTKQATVQADPGELVFTTKCSACHAKTEKVVGPPVTEMVSLYQLDINGLKEWIRKPGKKRADYPQMPALGLTEQEISDVTAYILKQ